ncbi:MAG: phosphoribosylglycinamide formyltransferase [Planctomycetota bacterium]
MSAPIQLGVLLSGSGRTLQNLIDRIAAGRLAATVRCVVADRPDAFGLERARRAGVPAFHERDHDRVFALMREHEVGLVCLAGYLRLLPIPSDYRHAILNIHPALLPKHGGKGFYGDRVHRAVLEAGERESGCTVHLCDEEYDRGQVLVQRRVPVAPDDTVESLAARVFAAECEAYPEAIKRWVEARSAGRL